MSKIKRLYSKEFKETNIEFTFTAESEKLNLIVEESINVSDITLSLVANHKSFPVFYSHSPNDRSEIIEIKLFTGEKYSIKATQGSEVVRGVSKTSKLTVSAIWGK
jgi:hypothetical protein